MYVLTHRYKQLSLLLATLVLLVAGLPLVHAEDGREDGHQGKGMHGGSMMMAGKGATDRKSAVARANRSLALPGDRAARRICFATLAT